MEGEISTTMRDRVDALPAFRIQRVAFSEKRWNRVLRISYQRDVTKLRSGLHDVADTCNPGGDQTNVGGGADGDDNADMLAGDALQALAFELLTPMDGTVPCTTQAKLCALLARSAGSAGMAGGQAIDLASVGLPLTERQLREMHQLKTGALLQGSVMMGAHCGAPDATALDALKEYGAAIGLAFQVVDDILDVTADSATLGKTAGKDADNDKPTYVSLMGLQASRDYAQTLLAQAHAALRCSGLPDTQALAALAEMVVRRTN